MAESRNAYRVLVERPEGKRPLGRPRRRWEDNIKMDLREVVYNDRDWINFDQDRDEWQAYVRAAMNLRAVLRDLVGVHKSTICRVVRNVTYEIALLSQNLIKPPTSDRERLEIQREFSAMSGFPRVFSPCRLFLLTAKVPTRIDFHFHYLEIQAIESKKPNQASVKCNSNIANYSVIHSSDDTKQSNALSLTVGDKVYSFLTGDETGSQEVDAMVMALATAIRNIFPTVPLQHIIRKVEVLPSKRIQQLQEGELSRSHDGRGLGPCGGFSTQYACMCDFHGMPYREEVSWDVDTIYLSHDTRELCLRDFDHLDPKDIVPIISALEYNTWFTKLRASNIKLTHEALDRILHVMKKSLSIEELYLDNLGVKWDFAHKLSLALIANNNTPLHTLDLSNNMIEDKDNAVVCK
ncbi:hypothetical protein ANN_20620 [Periplaneta americana]|uniref:CARMIL pleckstrin homology domain-containing protein n=1 Tax=Periplaneta americana TaxID=6978 RepID=A0ABQ8SE86_PERAM|nr:hypothetical protein ANN_20620 [Periplaneta americana]